LVSGVHVQCGVAERGLRHCCPTYAILSEKGFLGQGGSGFHLCRAEQVGDAGTDSQVELLGVGVLRLAVVRLIFLQLHLDLGQGRPSVIQRYSAQTLVEGYTV